MPGICSKSPPHMSCGLIPHTQLCINTDFPNPYMGDQNPFLQILFVFVCFFSFEYTLKKLTSLLLNSAILPFIKHDYGFGRKSDPSIPI